MIQSKIKKKELSATGAVSTDNAASKLYYVIFSGETAGDKLEIADGATNVFTLLTNTGLDPVVLDFLRVNEERVPFFDTDIAATITKTAGAYATFIYKEIE